MLDGQYTSVRLFDNRVQILRSNPPQIVRYADSCSKGTVIEADDSLYPCNIYVMDEWKLENVLEESLEALLAKLKADEFEKAPKTSLTIVRL